MAAGFDLSDGLGHQLVHGAPDLVIGLRDPGRIEIGADLAEHVLLARLLHVGADDFARIGLRVVAAFAELFGRPEAEQLVAPRQSP